jgi:hypothetical protein
MGNSKDTRGRNSFLGVVLVVVLVSWFGSRSGAREVNEAGKFASEAQGEEQVVNITQPSHGFGLELVGEHQPRLSNSYRFNSIFTFNKAVSADEAGPYFEFQTKQGVRVKAKAEAVSGKSEKLRISPLQLLEGGLDWELVLSKGLPSADGAVQFGEGKTWKLGRRDSVKISSVHAENRLNRKRAIHIEVSHSLQRGLEGQDVSRWVIIEQKSGNDYVPVKFEYDSEVHWRRITLSGPFSLNLPDRVRIKAGLPSRLGLKLSEQWERTVRFEPLPGRVYLADTATSQSEHGNRSFGFVSVNTQSVRLRVKRVDPAQGFRVIQSYYRKYLGRGDFRWSGYRWKKQVSQSLSYDLVPGQEVLSKVYSVKGKTDEAVTRVFEWDNVHKQRPGTSI